MVRQAPKASARRLHEAAWPDMLTNLQAAYADLTRTRFELERRATEIEEARDLFQRVIESMSEALFLMDRTGRVVEVNPAAGALLGLEPAELIGRPFAELCGECGVPVNPRQLLERSPAGTLPNLEVDFPTRGGRRVPVTISCGLVRDKRAKIVGMLAVARDVSERKRAEDALRFLAEASAILASSLDYETTLASVARLVIPGLADWCAVDVVEQDGSIRRLAVAAAEPSKAALAAELQRTYRPDSRQRLGVSRVLRDGRSELYAEVSDALLRGIAQDAAHRRLLLALGLDSLMVVPLVARGRTVGVISFVAAESGRRYGPADLALAEDLARRAALAVDNARLYREAQEAIQARDEFLSIAAHELRTPVAIIKTSAQLVLRAQIRGQLDSERAARALASVDAATTRLTGLIADLLDVSRIHTGRLPLRFEPFDLSALLRAVTGRYGEQLGERHRLVVEADESAEIVADASRLEQVLTNLIDNALKYSPQGGEIRLALRRADEGVRLEVHDHGIGLPSGSGEAIFQPFGRAANASVRQIPGLGLGLYICRDIVQRHGGQITATSGGEDHGTTLLVWLPTRPPTPATR